MLTASLFDVAPERKVPSGTWQYAPAALWAGLLTAAVSPSSPVSLAAASLTSAVLLSLAVVIRHPALKKLRRYTILALPVIPFLQILVSAGGNAEKPLEGVLLQSCLGLALALLSLREERFLPWVWGLLTGASVVACLFVGEHYCLIASLGTCILAAISQIERGAASGDGRSRAGAAAIVAVGVGGCAVLGSLYAEFNYLAFTGRGVMQTSGGNDRGSSAASRGVGDGPDVAKGGKTAHSTGFDQSDIYTHSDEPSLYDIFVESFGKPATKQKSFALKKKQVIKTDRDAALDLRNGKSFALSRSPPPPPPSGGYAAADAIFWVAAEQSQHIPLMRYGSFDGDAWQPEAMAEKNASIQNKVDEPLWFARSDQIYSPMLVDGGKCEISIGRYGDVVLPMPDFVHTFRIGQLNKVSAFASVQDDLIRIRDRIPPAGTTIQTRQRLIEPSREVAAQPLKRDRADRDWSLTYPTVARLASRWSAEKPAGFQQVNAVLNGLKHYANYDRDAPVSGLPGRNEIEGFLCARKGRAEHFATASALMLAYLGYDVRFVTGVYADTTHRDARSRQIAVQKADGHAWLEIRTAGNAWITLEPTPGFDIAVPQQNKLLRAAWQAWLAVKSNTNILLIALAIVIGGVISWRRWYDAALIVAMRLGRRRSPAASLRSAAYLIDRRAALWGAGRPGGQTLRRWAGQLDFHSAHARDGVEQFITAAEREWYGGVSTRDGRALALQAFGILSPKLLKANRQRVAQHLIET